MISSAFGPASVPMATMSESEIHKEIGMFEVSFASPSQTRAPSILIGMAQSLASSEELSCPCVAFRRI